MKAYESSKGQRKLRYLVEMGILLAADAQFATSSEVGTFVVERVDESEHCLLLAMRFHDGSKVCHGSKTFGMELTMFRAFLMLLSAPLRRRTFLCYLIIARYPRSDDL